jgi:hypothetical protein
LSLKADAQRCCTTSQVRNHCFTRCSGCHDQQMQPEFWWCC